MHLSLQVPQPPQTPGRWEWSHHYPYWQVSIFIIQNSEIPPSKYNLLSYVSFFLISPKLFLLPHYDLHVLHLSTFSPASLLCFHFNLFPILMLQFNNGLSSNATSVTPFITKALSSSYPKFSPSQLLLTYCRVVLEKSHTARGSGPLPPTNLLPNFTWTTVEKPVLFFLYPSPLEFPTLVVPNLFSFWVSYKT